MAQYVSIEVKLEKLSKLHQNFITWKMSRIHSPVTSLDNFTKNIGTKLSSASFLSSPHSIYLTKWIDLKARSSSSMFFFYLWSKLNWGLTSACPCLCQWNHTHSKLQCTPYATRSATPQCIVLRKGYIIAVRNMVGKSDQFLGRNLASLRITLFPVGRSFYFPQTCDGTI